MVIISKFIISYLFYCRLHSSGYFLALCLCGRNAVKQCAAITSSQLCIQGPHFGSLESGMTVVSTP